MISENSYQLGYRDGILKGREELMAEYPLGREMYDSKDWRCGTYAERVEWLHTMYESAKEQIAELERPRPDAVPYLYYDPENGDTWTQEAINDGFRLPDGLIALYTK